jgi:hypothetical protein
MASIQKLIACCAAAPQAPPWDKGRKKHQEKIQGKMKSTPLLFVMITASFASFPFTCKSRNNNRKNNNIISPGKKGFPYGSRHTARRKSSQLPGKFFERFRNCKIF